MEEYPSNSQNPRAEQPKETREAAKKIVSGSVTRRKRPLGVRFREMFLGDSDQNVMEYVIGEVLVPALKDMMTDAVSQGFERMIYGETRSTRRRSSSSNSTFSNPNHTNYQRFSANRRDDRPQNRGRSLSKFEDVILSSRAEAEDVVGTLIDYVGKYEVAKVADLYDLIGETSHHTDHKWGWTDLSHSGVRRVGVDSYLLILPKPEPID